MPNQIAGRRNQIKAKNINTFEKNTQRIKEELQGTLSILDSF